MERRSIHGDEVDIAFWSVLDLYWMGDWRGVGLFYDVIVSMIPSRSFCGHWLGSWLACVSMLYFSS